MSGPLSDSSPSPTEPMPIGRWLLLKFPDYPSLIVFTYVDPEAGFSGRGWEVVGDDLDFRTWIIVRFPVAGATWHSLDNAQLRAHHLDPIPPWLEAYGPQSPPGTLWGAWREHPHLKGRFLPDHPDDLEILIHNGGPRLTLHNPEIVRVSVTGMEGELFRGEVLNEPYILPNVSEGDTVQFIVAAGSEHPILVTDKYLQERPAWKIHPCDECGFSELFDAPSDLQRANFPDLPEDTVIEMFTASCPLCGGIQKVQSLSTTGPSRAAVLPDRGRARQGNQGRPSSQ